MYNRIVKMYFVVMFVCATNQLNADSNISEDQLFLSDLRAQMDVLAKQLNFLIESDMKNQVLSLQQQQEYLNNFIEFIVNFEECKNVVHDPKTLLLLENVKSMFIDRYAAWFKKIITDQYDQSIFQNLEAGDTASGRVTGVYQKIDDMCDLYTRCAVVISKYEKQFIAQIYHAIESFRTYSVSSKKTFEQDLNNAFQAFQGSVVSEIKALQTQYVLKFDIDPDNLTMQDRQFLGSLDSLGLTVLQSVKGLLVDLTSQRIQAKAAVDLMTLYHDSQQNLLAQYNESLTKNQNYLDEEWYEQLTEVGNVFLEEFSKKFKEEFVHLVHQVLVEHGGSVAHDGGVVEHEHVIKPTSHKAQDDARLLDLTQSLNQESAEQFSASVSFVDRVLKKLIRITNPQAVPLHTVSVEKFVKLSKKELEYIQNRRVNVVNGALKSLGIDKPLTLAFCCSGGGVRAMVGTLGLLIAAAKHNILQSSMYIAGLSGSTWMIAPWVAAYESKKIKQDVYSSLMQVQQSYLNALNDPNMPCPKSCTPAPLQGVSAIDFSYQVALRYAYQQPVTVVDLYGALVGNMCMRLLGKHCLTVRWSDMASIVQTGDLPLPLCAASFDGGKQTLSGSISQDYEWLEMSPLQAGSRALGYIPVKYLGSEFKQDRLETQDGKLRPEYPLSFYLGVYGSAFALTVDDIVEKGFPNPQFDVFGGQITLPVDRWMKMLIKSSIGAEFHTKTSRYFQADIVNFAQSANAEKMLSLFDAGIAFNFPLPVLFDRPRNVDVVILYDSNPVDGPSFYLANKYFKRTNNMLVPELIKPSILHKNGMSVFNDPRSLRSYDKNKATIIYFPTNVDVATLPYITLNFKYKPEETLELIKTVGDNFEQNVSEIKNIMELVAKARH